MVNLTYRWRRITVCKLTTVLGQGKSTLTGGQQCWGFCVWLLSCIAILSGLSSFAVIMPSNTAGYFTQAVFLLSSGC